MDEERARALELAINNKSQYTSMQGVIRDAEIFYLFLLGKSYKEKFETKTPE